MPALGCVAREPHEASAFVARSLALALALVLALASGGGRGEDDVGRDIQKEWVAAYGEVAAFEGESR